MRKIIKYFPNYYIYDNGAVWSLNSQKFIASSLCRGYEIIHLWKDNKGYTFRVNRLVAAHFIPNPKGLPEVNHIDGNKLNNKVENLEWLTRSDNILHSYKIGIRDRPKGNRKINEKIAQEIRSLKNTLTYQKIAERYGVKYSTVAHIMRGSRWGNSEKGSKVYDSE